jgi:chemosensory pili system protein ChpA (sensor histidine kinase/response regulator)
MAKEGSKKKVLFADDSPTIVEAAYDELDEKGYDVSVAYNGAEALELLEDETPDIIILDMEMPKKRGWEVAEKIRDNPKLAKIPIIALTALSPKTLGDKAKLFDAYLVKPFGFEEMTKMVVKFIGEP